MNWSEAPTMYIIYKQWLVFLTTLPVNFMWELSDVSVAIPHCILLSLSSTVFLPHCPSACWHYNDFLDSMALSSVFYQSAGSPPPTEKPEYSLLLSRQTFPLAQCQLSFYSSLWWNNLSNVSQKFNQSTVPCLAVVWLVHLMNSNTFKGDFSSLWNYLADYNVPYM